MTSSSSCFSSYLSSSSSSSSSSPSRSSPRSASSGPPSQLCSSSYLPSFSAAADSSQLQKSKAPNNAVSLSAAAAAAVAASSQLQKSKEPNSQLEISKDSNSPKARPAADNTSANGQQHQQQKPQPQQQQQQQQPQKQQQQQQQQPQQQPIIGPSLSAADSSNTCGSSSSICAAGPHSITSTTSATVSAKQQKNTSFTVTSTCGRCQLPSKRRQFKSQSNASSTVLSMAPKELSSSTITRASAPARCWSTTSATPSIASTASTAPPWPLTHRHPRPVHKAPFKTFNNKTVNNQNAGSTLQQHHHQQAHLQHRRCRPSQLQLCLRPLVRLLLLMPLLDFMLLWLPLRVGADEMAFVDVSSDDNLVVRTLDVRMHTKAGIAGFFQSDPMASHDWALRNLTTVVFNAHIKASKNPASPVAKALLSLRRDLQPLFERLPKNEHGNLDSGAVRFALHRYFVEHHGWAMKGLQPAGGAWTHSMSVTPDVRQLVKFIVPTFLVERTMKETGGDGVDIAWLAILVATLQHMVKGEMMDYLFFVFSAFRLKTGQNLDEANVDRIAAIFFAVYAFGTDLEVSTAKALDKAIKYLDDNHPEWQTLRKWIRKGIKQRAGKVKNFATLLEFLEELTDEYQKQQQQRHCDRAQEKLRALPRAGAGMVWATAVKPNKDPGERSLFSEGDEYWKRLGVLDENNTKVIIANYLGSQAFCLTTASFYSVCCRSPCDEYYARLAANLKGSKITAAEVAEVLSKDEPKIRESPLKEELLKLEKVPQGIELYSKSLADFLHRAFPESCPRSSKQQQTNPRTPEEWMTPPTDDVGETEELMSEAADVLVKFITEPFRERSHPEDEEDVLLPHSDVLITREGKFDSGMEAQYASRVAGDRATTILAFLCIGGLLIAILLPKRRSSTL